MARIEVLFLKSYGKYKPGNRYFVKHGFMRNFLLPKGISDYIDEAKAQEMIMIAENNLQKEAVYIRENVKVLQMVAKIKFVPFIAKASENNVLYAAVRPEDIKEALARELGINVKSFKFLDVRLSMRFLKNVGLHKAFLVCKVNGEVGFNIVVATSLSSANTIFEDEQKKQAHLK